MNYEYFKRTWIKSYEQTHGKTCKPMQDSLEKSKNSLSKETFYLSFCDPDKPEGSKFLGVIIVDGIDIVDAHCMTHFLGINPGGEVLFIKIPIGVNIKEGYKNRLLTKEEAEEAAEEIMD